MVTSNKLPEKKVVKMAGQSNSAVVPQRTLLGEVNEHITCPLCRGYYIDATTIVECLHSFCRSCIIKHLQVKSYCPVCEMMINSAKPNIKLDKALQDIVYKLVPGLFQKEMERRQQFYASRPGPAASATPEQRGEDTERIIFSPEDVISFSLEYADITDSDSISSKSSDSNEPQPNSATTRRFLQCPAVVNINHLKKFLSMKFDIDSSQFAIDILYKRVPLPDYYTLMDIAYIYNWKRNEPMRFFYQIIDYIAIRNRLFDINRKGSHFRDRKSSPISTEDTNISSPANNLNDQVSEGSSGADSPRPDDNSLKQTGEMTKNVDKPLQPNKEELHNEDGLNKNSKCNNICALSVKKNDNEVEKSQFLNSFELTAKNNCVTKASPTKMTNPDNNCVAPQTVTPAKPSVAPKVEETLKRKNQTPLKTPELKKLKIEIDKPKIPNVPSDNISAATLVSNNVTVKGLENPHKGKASETITKSTQGPAVVDSLSTPLPSKEIKPQNMLPPKPQVPDSPGSKRPVQGLASNAFSPKRKPATDVPTSSATSSIQKTVSPLKLQIPKLDPPTTSVKSSELSKGHIKKMPELKPSILGSQPLQNKPQPINKVRMDLFANNSDPTMDRSMILSQVKTSLNIQNNGQSTGDPLKSIFDSCNINIPSSLSITLTDQKIDNRNPSEHVSDQKKNIVNKNLATSSTSSHKVPSPPVHNYIEILKLPDTDSKKQNKSESNSDGKSNTPNKSEASSQSKVANKSEGSAKGPVPNLKPISDTKLSKQSILSTQTGNFSAPITFQQTFEQQLQSLHSDKKQKINKSKTQVPKLVPAPKVFNVVSKSCSISNKPNPSSSMSEPKPSSALDLSTPHNVQNQTGVKQTFDKALETMQSIANLANKQNLPSKGLPIAMSQNNTYASISNRPMNPGVNNTLRLPSVNTIAQMKLDKPSTIVSNMSKQEPIKNHPNKTPNSGPLLSSVSYQLPSHNSPSATQPSPRSQTRSPSSSPKLVIAEEKQINNSIDPSINQILNSAISTLANASKSESTKLLPGPSKPGLKPGKPMTPANKPAIRPSMTLNPPMNPSAEYLSRPQLMPSHHHFYSQVDVNAWLKVQRQFDFFKSMSNIAHQSQNDFNNKDKQK